jgi:hypothetical protein
LLALKGPHVVDWPALAIICSTLLCTIWQQIPNDEEAAN